MLSIVQDWHTVVNVHVSAISVLPARHGTCFMRANHQHVLWSLLFFLEGKGLWRFKMAQCLHYITRGGWILQWMVLQPRDSDNVFPDMGKHDLKALQNVQNAI